MYKYEIVVECKNQCQDWREPHVVLETDDVEEAISQSKIFRDMSHIAWVNKVMSNVPTIPKKQFRMTVTRVSSGLEGKFTTLDAALHRLKDFTDSFPDEVTEVHITRK